MSSVYRTAQGKVIDLDKLIHKNEMTLAVGNMRVNARGDKIGSSGNITTNVTPDQNIKRSGMSESVAPEAQTPSKKSETSKAKTVKSGE